MREVSRTIFRGDLTKRDVIVQILCENSETLQALGLPLSRLENEGSLAHRQSCFQIGNMIFMGAMRVIAKSTLVKFYQRLPKGPQATAESAMMDWYTTVSNAAWSNFADVKATFNSADYVSSGKIVFDVGGNKYRVVALIGFRTQRVFILFVGTHAEYDRIDVAEL